MVGSNNFGYGQVPPYNPSCGTAGQPLYPHLPQVNVFDSYLPQGLDSGLERAKNLATSILKHDFYPKYARSVNQRCQSPHFCRGGNSSWFSPTSISIGNSHTHNHGSMASSKKREKEDEGMSTQTRVMLGLAGSVVTLVGAWLVGRQLASMEESGYQLNENQTSRLQASRYTQGHTVCRILNAEQRIFERIRFDAKINLAASVSLVALGVLGVAAGVAGSPSLAVAAGLTALVTGGGWLVHRGYRSVSKADERDAKTIQNLLPQVQGLIRGEPSPVPFMGQHFRPSAPPAQYQAPRY